MHQIQRSILHVLTHQEYARFAELRPARVDSNLFSYHLKCLLREGLVVKSDQGYTLAPKGLALVDTISMAKFEPRRQPKIMTLIIVTHGDKILLTPRLKQPFITQLTLPGGKVHLDDESVLAAATREVGEKLALEVNDDSLTHVANGYVRAYQSEELISSFFAHVFRVEAGDLQSHGQLVTAADLESLTLAPGIKTLLRQVNGAQEQVFFEIESRR